MASAPLAVLAALAISACGSSHHASGPTRAQYISSADAICSNAQGQVTPLLHKLETGATSLSANSRQLAATAEKLHTLAAGYLARLSALPRPSADKTELAGIVTLTDEVVNTIGQGASALAAGNTVAALATLASAESAASTADKALHAYGLTSCAAVFDVS
ncbi:MAG TPA: hypothetical protein VHX88_14035 [Solirubrobacteraceae bacterium]|nr:hypothetical protein [Solirubrobacteraceae bacterium]